MKKFQAAAKQKLATLQDRSLSFDAGNAGSDNGPDQVKSQAMLLSLQGTQIRDVYKKLESQIKIGSTYIESGRNVGDSLKEFAMKLNPETPLANCVRNVSELQRDLEDAKADLQNSCLKLLYEPMRDSVKGEIKDALEAEKRYDKSKSAHESAVIKLRGVNEKAKANVSKIVEAEQERDATKSQLEQTTKDSYKTLYEMNFKVEVETMERLVAYTESYYEYFERSALRVRQLFKEIDSYRDYIDQRLVEYERETGRPLPHILEPRKKRPNTFEDDEDVVVKKEGKAIDRKQRTLDDIVIAERSYLNTLKNIKQNFMIPLQKVQKDPKLALKILDEDISAVFLNLEDLISLHNSILAELVSAQEMYPTKLVGGFLLQKLPQMQAVYTFYVNNFQTSAEALQELKKSRAVASFLKTCERTTTTSLSALLALPLKRINQYEFWFEKLFQDTNTTDPDFHNLEDSIELISQLAQTVVKGNEKGAELGQIMAVQKKIQGYEEDLVDPDRTFMKEGYLSIFNQKTAESPKKLHNYMCFLFNDILLYTSKSSVASRVQQARTTSEILQDSFVYIGQYFTHKMSIQDLPDTEDVKNAFHIVIKDKEPVLVIASSASDKQEWIQAIYRAIAEADKRKGTITHNALPTIQVYGVPLSDLLKHSTEQGRSVPTIIEKIVDYLETHALESEGLFRLSGGAVLIEKMKDLIDRGKQVELEGKDFHAIAGIFKLWLRELPDPLLTFAMYDQWLNAGKIEDKSQMIQEVRNLVLRLPQQNKYLLQYLCNFLVKVANKGSVNKMHAMNLSIVFGPNVLHQRNADAYDTTNMAIVYLIVQLFIEEYDRIFEGIDEERRNWEEKAMREVEEKREKEAAEQEKAKQGQKEEKREAKLKQEQEKEKRALQDKLKKEKEEEERKKEEKRVREELERKMREEIEVEKELEREKIKQELINEEKLKLSEQQKVHEQMLKEKLENEEAEYRKKREAEEAKYLRRRAEEEERQRRILEDKQRELDLVAKRQEEEDRQRLRDSQRRREEEEAASKEPVPPPAVEGPHCDNCGQVIAGQGLQALNKSWHSHCFVCQECKKPISGSFMHANGKPYCAEDYQKLFAKYCAGCNQVIVGPLVRAMGKEWHPQNCFVCFQCKGTLSTGFFDKGGKPYCKNCVQ